jgi:hypothetical protein
LLEIGTSGIGILMATKLVLLLATIGYYWHSYWHNTIDFLHYRAKLAIPAANVFLKYVYINSFLLFIFATAVLIASIVIGFARLETTVIDYSLLGVSVLLALGALRLLSLPEIAHWRKRAS